MVLLDSDCETLAATGDRLKGCTLSVSRTNVRQTPTWVTVLLGLLGLVLLAVAVIYFAEAARDLPSFFPGHTAHGSKIRLKHGIAAAVVAALVLIAAWFSARGKSAD